MQAILDAANAFLGSMGQMTHRSRSPADRLKGRFEDPIGVGA